MKMTHTGDRGKLAYEGEQMRVKCPSQDSWKYLAG